MMNNSNLYGIEWLNVVFSNRNKTYGAYLLRSQSSSILLRSLLIAGPLFILLFVGPSIYEKIFPNDVPDQAIHVVINVADPIHVLKKEEPKKQIVEKEMPKPAPSKLKVKTVNFSANIVVVDKEVADPPTSIAVASSEISTVTLDGAASKGNQLEPINTNGGSGGGSPTGTGNEIYNAAGIDNYPEFPGGMEAWSKFIQRNLRYPYPAQDNGTQGKVYLSFVVEKDGAITDVTVIRGIGSGCDEEAVRVIKKSPKWKAGLQNNQAVRVRYTMPIAYTLN